VLERIADHQRSYRSRLEQEAASERERRRASGEVSVQGCWVLEADAERVRRGLNVRLTIATFEASAAVVLLVALGYGVWRLFAFLFLP